MLAALAVAMKKTPAAVCEEQMSFWSPLTMATRLQQVVSACQQKDVLRLHN